MQSRSERIKAALTVGLRTAINLPYFLWYAATHQGVWQARKFFAIFYYSRGILRFWEDTKQRYCLIECPLDEHSVVFDVGGYRGEWAKPMKDLYNPYLHIFEPDRTSLAQLRKLYGNDPKVVIHPFGLAGSDRKALLRHAFMGSTIFESSPAKGTQTSEIALRDVRGVMDELAIPEVDLVKINIEGGEYELLDRMIETGLHRRCKRIRIQFHEWIPGSHRMYRRIRKALELTHDVEWHYPFVWESWVRKDVAARGAGAAPEPGLRQAG
jgi:FkbM family methyltransferase